MKNLTTPYAIPCVSSWFIAHDQTRSTNEECKNNLFDFMPHSGFMLH
jgi:hypothetical protein